MEVKEGKTTSEWKSLLITKVVSAIVGTVVLFANSKLGLNLDPAQIVLILLGVIGLPALQGSAYTLSRGNVKAAALNAKAAVLAGESAEA